MKFLTLILAVFTMVTAQAEDKIKMYYNNEELTKVIEVYSKASGQKFVVDPSVRGKISIFLQEPVAIPEAFNQLSSALAVNGFAISKQGDTMVIKSARNIQRDFIEVSTERPSLKPERMYTWIYNVKNLPADNINRDLRILMSRDGEMAVNANTNQIVFTDWVSNLNRVAELMKEIDKQVDPATAKLVEASKKEREVRRKEQANKKEEKKEKTEN
jgi:type II secretory pathway component GspD/PulD (secretin)